MPNAKPFRTGREMKFDRLPKRARPATTKNAPVRRTAPATAKNIRTRPVKEWWLTLLQRQQLLPTRRSARQSQTGFRGKWRSKQAAQQPLRTTHACGGRPAIDVRTATASGSGQETGDRQARNDVDPVGKTFTLGIPSSSEALPGHFLRYLCAFPLGAVLRGFLRACR